MAVLSLPVRQIAYFVADVRVAARRHVEMFGSGPYFVADHIPLAQSWHRGREQPLDHSSAYGQWGEVMIEFVQQNNSGPSAFHDLYPEGSGREGLHHVALFVDDLDASRRSYEEQGFPTALLARMNDGFAFAMMDAVERYGHMIELYEPVPSLRQFYGMVAEAARGFDGADPIRQIAFS
jgi:hypothetical protein